MDGEAIHPGANRRETNPSGTPASGNDSCEAV